MKEFAKCLVMAVMSLASSGCATGLVTQSLISGCNEADPPVHKYHAAYQDNDNIVLEYTVQNKHDRNFQRFSERYWATLHIDKLADHLVKGDYSIHRKPMTERKKARMNKIPIVDLRKHVSPASDGYMKIDSISAFLKQQSTNALPQVYICMGSSSQLYVRYKNYDSGQVEIYTNEPYDVFFPASRYPKLIVLYPFAIIGDIVTAPLLLLTPSWPM